MTIWIYPTSLQYKFKRYKSQHFSSQCCYKSSKKLWSSPCFHCNITMNIFPLISIGILKKHTQMNFESKGPIQMSAHWWTFSCFLRQLALRPFEVLAPCTVMCCPHLGPWKQECHLLALDGTWYAVEDKLMNACMPYQRTILMLSNHFQCEEN